MRNAVLLFSALLVFWAVYLILRDAGAPSVSWKTTGIFLIVIIICDHILTKVVMDTGKAAEANPVASFLFNRFGHLLSSVLIIFVGLLVLSPVWIYHLNTEAQIAVVAAYSLIPINGILVLWKIKRDDRRSRSDG